MGKSAQSVERDSTGRTTEERSALLGQEHRARQDSVDGGKQDVEADKEKEKTQPQPRRPIYKRPLVLFSISAVLAALILGAVLYWLHARQYVSTDDAYIDGHVTPISPQVPALVRALYINDNQLVHKGELLLELDPTDYQVALEQARAQAVAATGRLAQAQTQVQAAKASVAQDTAQIDAAQVARDNATRDLQRYQEVDERARSRQQLDNARAAAKNAQAQLQEAQARQLSAEANVATSEAAVKAAEGDLRTADANVKKAEVSLGYCRIYAPSAGRITERTVEAGAYVQTGQAMFSLVSPDVWVTANFKETQLKHMHPGQPVTIKVDAFPGTLFQGHVDSIQAGSGSRFSVLPAENATGNFVKVVQRVPVKILFEHGPNTNDAPLLSPGLSVIPKVKVL